MITLTITWEDTRRTEEGLDSTRTSILEFDNRIDAENFSSDQERAITELYNSYVGAESDGIFDDKEFDDGDTYNGETTNDINA